MIHSLAILCALEIEAGPIKDKMEFVEQKGFFDKRLGLTLFKSSKLDSIHLIQFGLCPHNKVERIGTQIASIAAWETIRTINPDVIASIGTAGGFKKRGAEIGDIYLSSKEIFFHGRHVPVPEYQNFELGRYSAFESIKPKNVKLGVISSSDSVPASEYDLIKMEKIGTHAKDMEAAAIAEVAMLTQTKVFALKAISDIVDSPQKTHEQFMQNFKMATENLAETVSQLISNWGELDKC